MIALMERAQELGTPADWLIRSTHDRALPEGAKLWACASEGEPLGEIAFTVRVRAKYVSTCGCGESSCRLEEVKAWQPRVWWRANSMRQPTSSRSNGAC